MPIVIGSKIYHYYNEWDPKVAAWLRELIRRGHIPDGIVDERSITEVEPEDLRGFRQWHFFAGIAGWPVALKLAGWPIDAQVCTGSPPCQPFSVAGKQGGRDDPRHLAPAFLDLVAELRPPAIFGEQVAAAIAKHHWLDALLYELEDEGYACGTTVLPACGVGAPHKRDRIFFGATLDGLAHPYGHADKRSITGVDGTPYGATGIYRADFIVPGESGGTGFDVRRMADSDDQRLQVVGPERDTERREGQDVRPSGLCDRAGPESSLAYAESEGQSHGRSGETFTKPAKNGGDSSTPRSNPHNSFWSDADWLGCRDGKFRPVEPGTFPLANGVPERVVRLRGYGNAIVPQAAAAFIRSFMVGSIDLQENV